LEKLTVSVLVVDDYKPWRNFIVSSLQKWPGLQVVGQASDGEEAVQKSIQLQPDLIVLDIGLPKVSGIEAARQIRQRLRNARILFCSENRSPHVAQEALRVGTGCYLVKSDAGRDLLSAVTSVIAGKRFVSRAVNGHAFAKISNPDLLPDHGHVVQFYVDDAVLLDELAALFKSSLGEGRSVASVMTSSHRVGLERRLITQGINLSEATRNGRLCMLDADQALSDFMDPGGPSRERFLPQFGNIMRTLKTSNVARGSRVLVFGEMVAVLWAQKKYEAAIRLEQWWNELALTSSFYLCCAYPVRTFREGLTVGHYAEICAQHSHVVSGFQDFRSTA